jgi:phosphoribosyl-ATP pyrophosphohydrolase
LIRARKKHPVFAKGQAKAVGVIMTEAYEMEHALEHETPERVLSECLDVVSTCLRLLAGEEQIGG